MQCLKKIFNLPFLIILIFFLASISIWIYLQQAKPLDAKINSSEQTIRSFIKPNRTLVVSFWASWCSYCMQEVATLKQLNQTHPDIDIIGIQVDDGTPTEIFLNAGYQSLNGSNNGHKIMFEMGNYSGAIPFIAILKDNGARITTFTGETSLKQLEQSIYDISKNGN